MNSVFQSYNQEEYLKWHNEAVESGNDFMKFLRAFRSDLKEKSPIKLDAIGQLLSQLKEHVEPECKLQTNRLITGEFLLPLKAFTKPYSTEAYDLLFKSEESIVEKCWRKNSKLNENFIGSKNFTGEIHDLIRTSVVCPTLNFARMFVDRLEMWKDFVSAENQARYFSDIVKIDVDKEAKPSRGYFAYHCLIHFRDGIPVEIQFYSILSSAWRDISHKLYEKSRIGESTLSLPGSAESRLISLGHLLHLAECELDRLVNEFKSLL